MRQEKAIGSGLSSDRIPPGFPLNRRGEWPTTWPLIGVVAFFGIRRKYLQADSTIRGVMSAARTCVGIRNACLVAGTMLYLVLAGLSGPVFAEEQLSREQYVAQSHDDLLAPCRSEAFVSCLETTEAQCIQQVNRLVETCSEALPANLTAENFNDSAVGYAGCVFDGLQEAFDKSTEEIGQCENEAGMR